MADNGIPPVEAATVAEVPVDDIKMEDTQAESAEKADTVQETKQEQGEAKQEESVDVQTETKDEPAADAKEETKHEPAADAQKEVKDAPAAITKVGESKAGEKARNLRNIMRKKFQENVKFDAAVLPESDDPAEMRKQVEFYFSDSNLPYDKFLFGLVGKENKPVPLKLIASFKRMKRFANRDTLVKALQESEVLELAGDAGEETIKRKHPLDITEVLPRDTEDERSRGPKAHVESATVYSRPIAVGPITDKAINKSIYAKGFGQEGSSTQVDIEKFFEPFGPICVVRLRRHPNGVFKGSVFVEFTSDEAAEKFMVLEEKPKWNGQDLLWKTKRDYVEGKIQDIKDGKLKPKNHKDAKSSGDKGRNNSHRGGGNRGGNRGRGRGGRVGRGRGGFNDRRGNRDDKPSNSEGAKKNENGIPQLKSSSEVDTSAQNGAAKRKATDDGAKDLKKTKTDESSTA